ncbi:hypothetical protein DPX16_16157 [Anabarilius grahami]|uniref:Uncharacterized protein n=1 Tax=Anabarilius grahami TaxID=495550 RepID=A0A3N0YGU1_ANAGA|nr:hypothetical protein DPX16_16157 [Anabarilius grahami]
MTINTLSQDGVQRQQMPCLTKITDRREEPRTHECNCVFPFMRRQRHSSPSPALATQTPEDDGKNSNSSKSNSGTASRL